MPSRIDMLVDSPANIQSLQHAFNGADRTADDLPEMILESSRQNQVAILSVGPWSQTIPCGSLGTKHIPACREGEEYSDPVVLEGLIIERYPLRENKMDILMHKDSTGWNVAHEMIGVGKHLPPSNSKVKYGLFVTKGNPDIEPLSEKDARDPEKKRLWLRKRFKPTAEEVAKANKALNAEFNRLVSQARSAAQQGEKAMEDTIRAERHILAAQKLGLDPKAELWMRMAVSEKDRIHCKFCKVSIPADSIKCQNCNEVLDRKAYEKLQAE